MLTVTQCVSYVLLTVVTCPELANPDNGMVDTSNNIYLSTPVYTCNSGYVLTPSDGGVRVCGADGEWTGVAPTCPREFVKNFVQISIADLLGELYVVTLFSSQLWTVEPSLTQLME